jgi:DNA-binding transcriptional ArsR family regulator
MVPERDAERVYKAIANRKRIAIIRSLKSGSATVGELAASIKLSIKATSRHMQILKTAGFIVSEQSGLYVHYELSPQSDYVTRVLRTIVV